MTSCIYSLWLGINSPAKFKSPGWQNPSLPLYAEVESYEYAGDLMMIEKEECRATKKPRCSGQHVFNQSTAVCCGKKNSSSKRNMTFRLKNSLFLTTVNEWAYCVQRKDHIATERGTPAEVELLKIWAHAFGSLAKTDPLLSGWLKPVQGAGKSAKSAGSLT